MDKAGIREDVRAFISQGMMPLARIASFDDDDSFLEKGILDSTGVLELVSHIEKHFAIRVETEEIIPDNLDSINKLIEFIFRKTTGTTI